MAWFDTGFVNTTFFGVSYGIRVAGNADRADGSTSVRFHGEVQERQNTLTWNTDAHNVRIDGLLGNGQIKPGGSGANGRVWSRGFDTTIGISIGTTSRGFTAVWTGGGNTRELGFGTSFNDGYSAPTGLSVSSPSTTENTVKAVVALSGWGNHSGGVKYRELTISKVNGSTSNRRFQSTDNTNALLSEITVTNSSSQTGSLTITPNTRFYLAGYASNGNRNTGVQFNTQAVTLSTGGRTVVNVRPSKVLFNVTAVDGHFANTIRFRYRKQGDSIWITSPESFVGSSGSIELANLKPATTYEMQQMVTTQAGTWYSSTFTVKTKPASIIIFPDNSKLNVSFRLIYPDGRKRDIERWKKISPDPGQVQYQGKDVRYSNKDVWYN